MQQSDHSDEQLRHLLDFKISSQLSQLCEEGHLEKTITIPPPLQEDLAFAPLHLELAEPKPGAAVQCIVHYRN